jgi:hypothetical protein
MNASVNIIFGEIQLKIMGKSIAKRAARRSHLAGMAANIVTSTGSYRTIDSPVLV